MAILTEKELTRASFLVSFIAVYPKEFKSFIGSCEKFDKQENRISDNWTRGLAGFKRELGTIPATAFCFLAHCRKLMSHEDAAIRDFARLLAGQIENNVPQFKTWNDVCGRCKGYSDQQPDKNCWHCNGKG